LAAVEVALRTCEAVRARAEEVKAEAECQDITPRFGQALAAFDKAVAQLEATGHDFQQRWPWFDQAKFERAVAEEQQGVKRRSLKEINEEIRRRVR
jgi:hypothetical protein